MKKAGLLVMLLLLLTGCSQKDDSLERGMELRSRILQSTQFTFDTRITADYGDKVYQFAVSCKTDPQGNLYFRVQQPETISDITGTISDSGGKLTFDNVALQFDKMADDQVTPVSAPWIFIKTLRSGNLTSAGLEGDALRLSLDDSYEEDALHVDIWLDTEDIPQRAEIVYDGKRILSLDVKNFQIQ